MSRFSILLRLLGTVAFSRAICAADPPPLEGPLPAGAGIVPLELRTSLEREDLLDAASRFRVTIVQGDPAGAV